MTASRQPVIFCDFDGTITENDNVISLMEHFNPEGWEAILDLLIEGKLSLRDALQQMFGLFSSKQKQHIVQYVLEHTTVRQGFAELLDYCRNQQIPFMVTSGGVDFLIEPILAPFPIDRKHIYCNRSDFTKEHIQIHFPHPCDDECDLDCGMCKVSIIRSYPQEHYFRILIGDSYTDFAATQHVDLIFARSHLIEECQKQHTPYVPYETFHDVVDVINEYIMKNLS